MKVSEFIEACKDAMLWVAVGGMALLVTLATCSMQEAHAHNKVTVELGAGASNFTLPHDGNWHQRGYPHDFDEAAMAWKAGIAYHFSPQWSIKASYVNFGAFKVKARFVDDDKYDVTTHSCRVGANCGKVETMTGSDAFKGYFLSFARTFNAESDFTQYLELGGGILTHRQTIHCCTNHVYQTQTVQEYYGRIPALSLGGGLCWKVACIDTTLYQKMGVFGANYSDTGYPMTDAIVTTMFVLKAPIY